MTALTLVIEYYPVAKLVVPNPLAKPHSRGCGLSHGEASGGRVDGERHRILGDAEACDHAGPRVRKNSRSARKTGATRLQQGR